MRWLYSLVAIWALTACGDDPSDADPSGAAPVDAEVVDASDGDAEVSDALVDAEHDATPPEPRPDCDDLVPEACALPWPSNLYLTPDAERVTGYTVDFGATTLPINNRGVQLAPDLFRRMDGYGPGTPIITRFPHLDATGLPDELRIEESLAPNAQILLFEVTPAGLERVPYFAELDSRQPDAERRVLYVRPAVLLKEDTRYVVAFRGLVDVDGDEIQPSPAFVALRDEGASVWAPRAPRFEEVFNLLEGAGVARAGLILAWDFHTASSEAMHGRMLHMRDDAFEQVGVDGPMLTLTSVTRCAPAAGEGVSCVDEHLALKARGTFRVPIYLDPEPGPHDVVGWAFHEDAEGRPAVAGWREADFWLRVPHSAVNGAPHGLLQYGHGLNGRGSQVTSGHLSRLAQAHGLVLFAANWTGMSEDDVPATLQILMDFNKLHWMIDRLHQGVVENLLLMRGMRRRLAALPELAELGVSIDPGRSYYTGDSQGGIYGATYMALSQDVIRGVLGVPGQNYVTLLQRSVDFDAFFLLMDASYPDPTAQAVLIATVQLAWDAVDPVSYWGHLSGDLFPNTPEHAVIAAVAKGDYQVSPMTMEIVARTGLLALMPHYDEARAVALVPTAAYPHLGSALVNWHFGNDWPPPGNLPPAPDAAGDPHGKPRKLEAYQAQMVTFFRTGEVIDVCDDAPCVAQE